MALILLLRFVIQCTEHIKLAVKANVGELHNVAHLRKHRRANQPFFSLDINKFHEVFNSGIANCLDFALLDEVAHKRLIADKHLGNDRERHSVF